jgi:T-complex protein 1 subunit delta
MDNQIVVNDYRQMDKILKEERLYILNLCKAIKKSGCNVLLIQKSILRDAVNELALAYLQKLKILAIKDVERDEIEFLSRAFGCKPISDVEQMTADKLGEADLVEETSKNGAKFVKVSGIKNPSGKTVSVLCTGANAVVLEESERSLHDALCVVRCLVKKRFVPLRFPPFSALTDLSPFSTVSSSPVVVPPKSTSPASSRNTLKPSRAWKPTASPPTPKRSK